ncbi:MAG: CotH kinase family protein [Candidatus Magnetomorum sp.]|nr:CotH kinase family protein [Candidatus Magnetomorum sp.]
MKKNKIFFQTSPFKTKNKTILAYEKTLYFIFLCLIIFVTVPHSVFSKSAFITDTARAQQADHILINEFMASNQATLKDNDGDYSDWIELANPLDQAIDIGGMYLTDNLAIPDKWQIPSPTIVQSKGLIVFWASGKNRQFHTNFKLDKEGEDIGLFDVSRNQIDTVHFDLQSPDISYGRKINDYQTWTFFHIPTPNQPNAYVYFDINQDGDIDLKDCLLALQISSGQNTLPGPIALNIDEKVGIESAIFILKTSAGLKPEPDMAKFETLFTHGQLHDIEIVISQQEWDGLIEDMHDYIKTGRYRQATFIYKGPAGDEIIEKVGFRVKGNISRTIPQDENNQLHRAHFKVKFNETFELSEDSPEYQSQKIKRFNTLTALIFRLNIALPDSWDHSQIRELFCYDRLNKVQVKTSRTGSSKLTITIGGVQYYFGIYTLIEPINKAFLTKRYSSSNDNGNLYKCILGDSGPASLEPVDGIDGSGNGTKVFTENRIIGIKDWKTQYRPTYDLKTNEREADHSQLLDFIHKLNTLDVNDLSENGLKYYLDTHFGMDHFLRYMAMNMLLGRWDDYWSTGNNYYLYFNPDGKIDFIPCDYDSALSGIELFYLPSQGIYEWSNHVNELISVIARVPLYILNAVKQYHSPLVEKIFQIQAYRTQYEDYLEAFISPSNRLFSYTEYENKFHLLNTLYSPYLNNDIDEGEEMFIEEKVKNYFQTRIQSMTILHD